MTSNCQTSTRTHELDIISAFQIQAANCQNLGSPFTGRFCELFAQNLKPDNKVAAVLFHWSGDLGPYGASLPLRLAGAFHALVLEGRSESLRAIYPPHHEKIDDMHFWGTLEATLHDHPDFILQRLQNAPQTNEVRRSGALLPGFLSIAQQTGLSFILSEIGASTGLNLLWDCYHYQLGDISWGNPAISNASPERIFMGDGLIGSAGNKKTAKPGRFRRFKF